MDKFITQFKEKAHNKALTKTDMATLCVYKTIKAKSEHKIEVAQYYFRKAFSSTKSGSMQSAREALSAVKWSVKENWKTKERSFSGILFEELFSGEEVIILDKIIDEVEINDV